MGISKAAGIPVIALAGGFLGGVLAGLFVPAQDPLKKVLDEITVKRVNVVEDNGRLALVMANSRNLPGGIRDGKQSGQRTGIPGIIFYNNLGDEIGGLIYPARAVESGYDGGVQLSMDQIKQTGQAVALRHWRSGDYVRSLLEITDYSTEKFAGDANEDPEIGAVLKRLGEAAEPDQERIFKDRVPAAARRKRLPRAPHLPGQRRGRSAPGHARAQGFPLSSAHPHCRRRGRQSPHRDPRRERASRQRTEIGRPSTRSPPLLPGLTSHIDFTKLEGIFWPASSIGRAADS